MYSNIIITSQLRLQLRAPCVPPPIFVFRCYDNIQPPVCTYLNINYSVYIIVNIYVRVVAPGTVCPGAHFCVREICIITNNGVPIQHLPKNPNTISTHIFAIQPFQNIPTNFPSWRRYTFLRVRLRNQRFLPHPQKNWSPLRTVFI